MTKYSRKRVTTVGPVKHDPDLIVRVKNGVYGGEAFELHVENDGGVFVMVTGEYGYDDTGTFQLTRTEALQVAHVLLDRLTEKCGAEGVAGTCGRPESHAGEHSYTEAYP